MAALACCSGKATQGGGDAPSTPGKTVAATLPPATQAEFESIQASLAATDNLTADSLTVARALPFAESLGYDPSTATNLPLVQGSPLRLSDPELSVLGKQGFVVSATRQYPGFTYGYADIYAAHLPLFISADSIMNAVHRSYDKLLANLEREVLAVELAALLTGMRANLSAGAIGALGSTVEADVDVYLAVAKGLLDGAVAAPVKGGAVAQINTMFTKARAGTGMEPAALLGMTRAVDYSQFKPRGHYVGDPQLERYFQAMMWLGRMDLPFIGTDSAGKAVFHRSLFLAAAGLSALVESAGRAHFDALDTSLRAFVGEPDAMEPADFPRLLADLKIATVAELSVLSDEALAQAIVAGGYGKQAIASQVVIAGPHAGTLPLDTTFLLLGQRYVLDSHVFSNVVYDRVNIPGVPRRMMPDPLDVAYAALGNNAALSLLSAQLSTYQYAPDLEKMRLLADRHGADFFGANLYNLWLSALRSLSPTAAQLQLSDSTTHLPMVARTEPWARRVLNTQLASWAELRHDTILYAKQSYTSGVTCDFPDVYVEPVPAFYGALAAYATKGKDLLAKLPTSSSASNLRLAYFDNLLSVAYQLGALAEAQAAGTPPTAEQLAFVNQAVTKQGGICGGPPIFNGWYPTLFFARDAGAFKPTIADVHTQPTDEGGAMVGKVLHVGTGYIRAMTVTIEACDGPRAYVGLVSSYHEATTENFARLTDNDWETKVQAKTVAVPAWQATFVAGSGL